MAENEVDTGREKLNKSQFLHLLAEKHCNEQYGAVNPEQVRAYEGKLTKAYTEIVDGIAYYTGNGYELSLTGFGVFVMKHHKGHPVQFGKSKSKVSDYDVLKFSASDVLNRRLRNMVKNRPSG